MHARVGAHAIIRLYSYSVFDCVVLEVGALMYFVGGRVYCKASGVYACRYLTLCKYSLRPFRCTDLPWDSDPEPGISTNSYTHARTKFPSACLYARPMQMSMHVYMHRLLQMSSHMSISDPETDHPRSVLTVYAEMACGSTEHRMYQVSIFVISAYPCRAAEY